MAISTDAFAYEKDVDQEPVEAEVPSMDIVVQEVSTILRECARNFEEIEVFDGSDVRKDDYDNSAYLSACRNHFISKGVISAALDNYLGENILSSVCFTLQHQKTNLDLNSIPVVLENLIRSYVSHFNCSKNIKLPYFSYSAVVTQHGEFPAIFGHSARQRNKSPSIPKKELQKDIAFRMAISYPNMRSNDPEIRSLTLTHSAVQCGEYSTLSFALSWASEWIANHAGERKTISIYCFAISNLGDHMAFCDNCVRFAIRKVMELEGLIIVDNAFQVGKNTPVVGEENRLGFLKRKTYQSEKTSKLHDYQDKDTAFTEEDLKLAESLWSTSKEQNRKQGWC